MQTKINMPFQNKGGFDSIFFMLLAFSYSQVTIKTNTDTQYTSRLKEYFIHLKKVKLKSCRDNLLRIYLLCKRNNKSYANEISPSLLEKDI